MELIIKCPDCKHKYQLSTDRCPICSSKVVVNIEDIKNRYMIKSRKKARKEALIGSIDRFINVFLGNA